MSFTAAIFVPLVLLVPAAGAVEPSSEPTGTIAAPLQEVRVDERGIGAAPRVAPAETPSQPIERSPLQFVLHGIRPDAAYQVRIEQRMTIRISPRRSPMPPNSFVGVPERPIGPRFVERKIGKCLEVERISGVQADRGNDLLLFLSDSRIVRAELERSCRARDFYSGFYLSRSDDGRLCVDRDALHSRSGTNCRLTRIRQLVEVRD